MSRAELIMTVIALAMWSGFIAFDFDWLVRGFQVAGV